MSFKPALARHKKIILLVIIVILAIRVFIPQLDALADSLQTLTEANPFWVLLAAILYFTGVPVMAVQFTVLSFKKLFFPLTLRVQAAALFVNKIVPQGVGTISLNIYYLIKKKHTPSEATAVITMNAIASTSAYIVLIIGALIFSDVSLGNPFESAELKFNITALGLLCLLGIAITILNTTGIKKKIVNSWAQFKVNIARYKKRPKALLINTVFNGIGTSLNILALMCSAQALGVDISFADALLAYTFGNFAATLVPTPGGIGSAEMGIYSGLVLTGIDPAMAISITLLYRFVSYWLPILPGYYYFHSLRKTLFADYSVKAKKTA